jgi:hypothetical protein
MVSEFLCAVQGCLSYFDQEKQQQVYATQLLKYGKGNDGYWNAEKMIAQTKTTIAIFKLAFPSDKAVFAFDNSSGHACKASDALITTRMNLKPGGKQPIMHNTVLECGRVQSMVFQQEDTEWDSSIPIPSDMIGKAKGMQRVMQERGS